MNFRSVAIVVVVALAVAAFSVLSAGSQASRLEIRESAEANGRGAFDILVRPPGSRQGLEGMSSLVQAGYLAGTERGISRDQWQHILGMDNVEVAAPLAVVGVKWADYWEKLDVDIPAPAPDEQYVMRVNTTYTYDNGASTVASDPVYFIQDSRLGKTSMFGVREAQGVTACEDANAPRFMVNRGEAYAFCASTKEPGMSPFARALALKVPFPQMFPMIAVDPEQEAKLNGLDRSLVGGEYFPSERPESRRTNSNTPFKAHVVPVLVSSDVSSGVEARSTVDVLPPESLDAVFAAKDLAPLDDVAGNQVAEATVLPGGAIRNMLDLVDTAHEERFSSHNSGVVSVTGLMDMLKVSPPSYSTRDDGSLVVEEQRSGREHWVGAAPPDLSGQIVPPGGDDTAVRSVTPYVFDVNASKVQSIMMAHWGTFDPDKLASHFGRTATQLGAYSEMRASAGDEAAKAAIGAGALAPSLNLGGYINSGPTLVTSIEYLDEFARPGWERVAVTPEELAWVKEHGPKPSLEKPFDWVTVEGKSEPLVNPEEPLSAIRVRVAGVTGADEMSRERVRLVAETIEAQTGLVVDIMIGASPAPQAVVVPAGKYGRPEMVMNAEFTKKGVVAAIVQSVDRKSLMLSLLVLCVCVFFVMNVLTATVRARRPELAIRRAVGWTPGHVYRLITREVLILGSLAGVLGAVVAAVVLVSTGTPFHWWHPLLAAPGALCVMVPAGTLAAWDGAKTPPMQAVHAPVQQGRMASPKSLPGFAWMNVRREPGRAALAACGISLAVVAVTVVFGLLVAFRGAVVGSLLGDAVAVQVRDADIAAVVGVLVLGMVGVANMMWLSLRERAAEFALFAAAGWTNARVATVAALEGVTIGGLGGVVGAGVGAGVIAGLVGSVPSTVWVVAAVAVGVSACGGAVAAVVPTVVMQRTSPAVHLASA